MQGYLSSKHGPGLEDSGIGLLEDVAAVGVEG